MSIWASLPPAAVCCARSAVQRESLSFSRSVAVAAPAAAMLRGEAADNKARCQLDLRSRITCVALGNRWVQAVTRQGERISSCCSATSVLARRGDNCSHLTCCRLLGSAGKRDSVFLRAPQIQSRYRSIRCSWTVATAVPDSRNHSCNHHDQRHSTQPRLAFA